MWARQWHARIALPALTCSVLPAPMVCARMQPPGSVTCSTPAASAPFAASCSAMHRSHMKRRPSSCHGLSAARIAAGTLACAESRRVICCAAVPGGAL